MGLGAIGGLPPVSYPSHVDKHRRTSCPCATHHFEMVNPLRKPRERCIVWGKTSIRGALFGHLLGREIQSGPTTWQSAQFSGGLAQKRGLTPYRRCRPAFKSQWGRGPSPFWARAARLRGTKLLYLRVRSLVRNRAGDVKHHFRFARGHFSIMPDCESTGRPVC